MTKKTTTSQHADGTIVTTQEHGLLERIPWATIALIAAATAYAIEGMVDALPPKWAAALSLIALIATAAARTIHQAVNNPRVVTNILTGDPE